MNYWRLTDTWVNFTDTTSMIPLGECSHIIDALFYVTSLRWRACLWCMTCFICKGWRVYLGFFKSSMFWPFIYFSCFPLLRTSSLSCLGTFSGQNFSTHYQAYSTWMDGTMNFWFLLLWQWFSQEKIAWAMTSDDLFWWPWVQQVW